MGEIAQKAANFHKKTKQQLLRNRTASLIYDIHTSKCIVIRIVLPKWI